MIERIHIQNFKSVVDLELELGKLNVFIGENGCGKTNILEAITFGAAATGNKLDNEFLATRGIRVTDSDLMRNKFGANTYTTHITTSYYSEEDKFIRLFINEENKINKQFFEHDLPYKMILPDNIEVPMDKIMKEAFDMVQENDHDEETKELFRKISGYYKDRLQEVENEFAYEKDIINFLNYAPENYFLRRFEEEGQIRPLGIRGEGLFKHLVDIYKKEPALLEKIGEHLRLIGWFEGFEIPTDLMFTERRINIKDKYLQELDFFDQRSANEGFLYLLFYFTLFLSPFTPKFFAIDNIDNSLNPKLCAELIRQLVKISKENEKQTILTTHNPAILDGLDLTDDSQRLFTIYRNAEGHTEAKRIKAPKIVKGVEPVRLSEAYIRGYLGGLPKNF